jgi:membrane fusion protein, multidrug efflux system
MPRNRLIPLLAAVLTTLAVVVGGGYWWIQKRHFETTDNAYVQAETVTVSPQIEGYVAEVLVGDNQRVAAGQVLVRIDPSDARSRLEQAQAALAQAQAGLKGVNDKAALEKAMIAQRAAGVASAQAAADKAHSDLQRNDALAKQGWVSSERLQDVQSTSAQRLAGVAQAQAALEAERRTSESLGSAREQALAQISAAQAALEKARTDLDRTTIRAPVAGVVGARGVRPGQYVRPGGALMAVVPLGEAFVIANFKETQVARLRLGQPVQIRADAFGDKAIVGRVESFAPATGQEFALIPVENAVGNFTKIAQRLPVRIAVDRKAPLARGLRPGLSVKIKVDVTANTGPSFAESAGPQDRLASHDATEMR